MTYVDSSGVWSSSGTEFQYRKSPVRQHGAGKPFSLLFGFPSSRAGRFAMARSPKPWFRKGRRCWFVTIDELRHNLGSDREAVFREFHELMARPKRRAVASMSVVAVFDAFMEWTRKHRAERTYEWYQQRCQWFVDAIPDLSVDQLQPYHVQEWIDGPVVHQSVSAGQDILHKEQIDGLAR